VRRTNTSGITYSAALPLTAAPGRGWQERTSASAISRSLSLQRSWRRSSTSCWLGDQVQVFERDRMAVAAGVVGIQLAQLQQHALAQIARADARRLERSARCEHRSTSAGWDRSPAAGSRDVIQIVLR
jgi:hypothetical protein